jgi:hypothetical protein
MLLYGEKITMGVRAPEKDAHLEMAMCSRSRIMVATGRSGASAVTSSESTWNRPTFLKLCQLNFESKEKNANLKATRNGLQQRNWIVTLLIYPMPTK